MKARPLRPRDRTRKTNLARRRALECVLKARPVYGSRPVLASGVKLVGHSCLTIRMSGGVTAGGVTAANCGKVTTSRLK